MQTMQKSTLSTYSLSAMVLLSAMTNPAATAAPLWNPPKIEPKRIFAEPLDITASIAETNIGIAAPVGDATFIAPKERALRALQLYHPDNPLGDTSIVTNPLHIEVAKGIIHSLPAGFPIPWVNRNDDGEVGLYWDDDDAYADIDIDADGQISFYSKLRSTGEEQFIAGIALADFTPDWAGQHLELLTRKTSRAA